MRSNGAVPRAGHALVLLCVGLYLFLGGFFLSRLELKEVSPLSDSQDSHRPLSPRFKRCILVVVDALRFDFVAPAWETHPSYDKNSLRRLKSYPLSYENKLQVIRKKLSEEPSQSLLFQCVADPPTTTSQRLRALTTGTLPTFMDQVNNFDSDAIQEDNLINQVSRMGKRVVFMGDDTWTKLYPGSFSKAYPYPSFNVQDLDTVDNGILSHLMPEVINGTATEEGSMKDSEASWDLLVAHFLGVDHAGHRYGPFHVEMKRKLQELERTLGELMDALDEDTLLVVVGDHGMSQDGNHGGAAPDETNAALFFYSKSPIAPTARHSSSEHMSPGADGAVGEGFKKVNQIDLVPTLALLLGAPIPYSSVGSPVPEIFLRPGISEVAQAKELADAYAATVKQVLRYLHQYADAVPQHARIKLEHILGYANAGFEAYEYAMKEGIPESFDAASALFQSCLKETLRACREEWVTFDLPRMGVGMMALFLSCVLQLPHAVSLGDHYLLQVLALIVCAFGAAFGDLFDIYSYCAIIWTSWVVKGICRGLINSRMNALSCILAVIVCIHAVSVFSNSYLITEDAGVFAAVMTIFLSMTWAAVRIGDAGLAALCFTAVASIRIGFALQVHRSPKTHEIDGASIRTIDYPLLQTWLPLVALVAATFFISSNGAWTTHKAKISQVFNAMVSRRIVVHVSTSLLSVVCMLANWELDEKDGWSDVKLMSARASLAMSSMMCALSLVSHSAQEQIFIWLPLVWAILAAILIAGPKYPISYSSFLLQTYALERFSQKFHQVGNNFNVAVVQGLLGLHLFFSSGHQCSVNSVHFHAGFLVLRDYNLYVSGALVILNTFAPMLLATFAAWKIFGNSTYQGAAAYMVSLTSIRCLVTAACQVYMRRHLMVFTVFAPKLLFDAVAALLLSVLIVGLSLCTAAMPHHSVHKGRNT